MDNTIDKKRRTPFGGHRSPDMPARRLLLRPDAGGSRPGFVAGEARPVMPATSAGVAQILTLISGGQAPADSLAQLCRAYDASHPGAVSAILLIDHATRRLRTGAAPGLPADCSPPAEGWDLSRCAPIWGKVAAEHCRAAVDDLEQQLDWDDWREPLLRAGLRSCWATPIVGTGATGLGVFVVYRPQPGAPSEDAQAELDTLAAVASLAIQQLQPRPLAEAGNQGFGSLFEQYPDAVFALDRDGIFRLCNSRYLHLTNRPAEHYIGRAIEQAVPRQFRQRLRNHLDLALEGKTTRYDLTTVDSAGERIELVVTVIPMVAGGRYCGAFTILTDATPRRLIEEELRHSLKRSIRLSDQLRQLSEAAVDANVHADDGALIQRLADALRRTIGAREVVLTTTSPVSGTTLTVAPADRFPDWEAKRAAFELHRPAAAVSARSGAVRLSRDQLAGNACWRAFTREARNLAPRHGWLGVPLVARDGHELGLLQLLDPAEDEFTGDDELVALQFAQTVSAAIERRQLMERLQVSDRFFEMSLEPFAIYDIKAARLVKFNDALCRVLGRDRAYLLQHGMTHLAHPDERELLDSRVREAYYRRKENGPQQTHQYNYVLPDGSLRLIEWSWYVTPEGLMYAVGRDNTDRHKAEARLAHAMTHDAVTDLPRMERLEETLKDLIAGQPQRNVAVMFMDLDRFFSINESMGHTTADRVLAAVAGRLRKIVPAAGQLSRISGDEFLAVLPDCSAADANALAGQVQGALSEPIAVDGYKIRLTVSIGIAAYPDHGGSSVDLIRRAQAALVNAKRQGRDAICVFTAEQVHDIQDRQLLGNHLRNAVERNEMVLHYQPQYEAETHRLSGFEALIRWQSPQLGLIFPSRFISVAESIGVMPELGEWVIRETCRQMRAWQEAGHDGFTVSVNVAAQQLLRPGLADLVASALAEYGLAGDRLEIELTESSAMQNVERTRGTLHALKALGVNIALDDFGTGYSSLAYLKQFAVDKLKIDKSFVRDLPDDANDAAIARTIIGVGHQLRMRVSAEGVETGRQRDFLVAIGCDELQGFLFSPGVAAADATHMLASR